jgi:hypothetical protein
MRKVRNELRKVRNLFAQGAQFIDSLHNAPQ